MSGWLECAGNVTDFRPPGTRDDYEFTRVDLTKNGGPGDKALSERSSSA